MTKNNIFDISNHFKTSLATLVLPQKYIVLIKQIEWLNVTNLKFIFETVGDVLLFDSYQLYQSQQFEKQYIELNYVEPFIEFKKELPIILSNVITKTETIVEPADELIKTIESVIEPTEKLVETIELSTKKTETHLCHLNLLPQYHKLIKVISRSIGVVNTIQDILNINPMEFAQQPAVGKLYVNLLVDFQKKFIQEAADKYIEEIKIENITEELHPQEILSKLYVNYGFLTAAEIKHLKKVEKLYGKEFDIRNVNTLLNLDKTKLAKQTGLGSLTLNVVTGLQQKIKNELKNLPENITEYTIKQRSLFISNEISFVEFYEIDNILIEDIEGYLYSLVASDKKERSMDIAQSRWGFNIEHKTLEELGVYYEIERERIRQIEKTINANLPLNFRIQPKVLWANIREKMTEDLTELLPNLAKCFATEKLFYTFIELCCQVESGSISEIAFTKISSKIINSFFCFNPSPISQEIIINELMSNYGHSKASAVNGLKQLEKNDRIEITAEGIYPKKLGRAEAVAHVLTFHPSGLPWKDISKIINQKSYSLTLFDETKANGGFSDSEYVYLCGHGTYRHLMFLDLGKFNIPEIIQHLLDYFEQRKLNALHLHDYYQQNKMQRAEIEYFTLRHIVRGYGDEYGVFFNGHAGADSISIDKNAARITQADVVVSMLNESKVAMTIQEIAERLRSKSTGHASFYLDTLMKEGRVIRVDHLVYTTPEKAFSKIDVDAVMRIIESVMNARNTIVDADIFREYVNMELNLSYSKYIYAALVRTKLNELGWHRNNTLFSKNPILYKNLADMCRQFCKPELSNRENAEILQQEFWLTNSVTLDAIQQWRTQMNQAENDLVGEVE
jgi:hypothetical protein